MTTLAERFRDLLVPVLFTLTGVLALLLAVLFLQRGIRTVRQARRDVLTARYRLVVAGVLAGTTAPGPELIRLLPRRHRAVVGGLLLAPLRVVQGEETIRARELAGALGLLDEWRASLSDRRWWRIANAAIALGLVRDTSSVAVLIGLLDHDHEQVRAAAIDAVGLVGDVSAISPLIARMSDPGRHERARVVEALSAFGETATEALLARGNEQPSERALVAGMLAHIGGVAAAEPLLAWTADASETTRAAAWRTLAAIGLSHRAFYHALKALRDTEPAVRAAAAAALGRAGRADAARYLAVQLDDEWDVAAEVARALGRLGPVGLEALHARADGVEGPGQDMAMQMLWQRGATR